MSQTTRNYSHDRHSFISGVIYRCNKDDRRGESDTVQTGIPTTGGPLCDFGNGMFEARGMINWPENSSAFIEPEDCSKQPAVLFSFFFFSCAATVQIGSRMPQFLGFEITHN